MRALEGGVGKGVIEEFKRGVVFERGCQRGGDQRSKNRQRGQKVTKVLWVSREG